ncbi:MAG: PhzF family phenazine biosynthesis protein [Verrucomicrobiales bacterium]
MDPLLLSAFADPPAAAGNPAGFVFVKGTVPPDAAMQALAAEVGFPETAFAFPPDAKSGAYPLRWFTPAVEVDLCGHATLAAARALWDHGIDARDAIAFSTRSGILTARRGESDSMIWLDFPEEAAAECGAAAAAMVREALRLPGGCMVLKNRMDFLACLESEDAVLEFAPDFAALGALPARGVILTAPAGERAAALGCAFVSRFFAPQCGVPEDHATGSAHCALARFWAARLDSPAMRGWQASPRGGVIAVQASSPAAGRVSLGGNVVPYQAK